MRAGLPRLTARAATAFRLFERSLTQFRYSMDGPTGLDYPACRFVAQMEGIRFAWVWRPLQALEREWLSLVHKRQAAAGKKPPEPEKPKGKR